MPILMYFAELEKCQKKKKKKKKKNSHQLSRPARFGSKIISF